MCLLSFAHSGRHFKAPASAFILLASQEYTYESVTFPPKVVVLDKEMGANGELPRPGRSAINVLPLVTGLLLGLERPPSAGTIGTA